jgi:sensor histidine kinase YesM
LFTAIGLGFSIFNLAAQEPYFNRYTVEDGLPSNEIYGMVFDHRNILWAITDRGVWRFDGYQSRHVTVADGLKENTNFRIFKDRKNNIWLSSVNNYLFKIVGDSVLQHPCSQQVHQTGQSDRYLQQLSELNDSCLMLSYNRRGLFCFRPGQAPEMVTGHHKGHENASVCIFLDSAGVYWDMINYPDTNQLKPTVVEPQGNRIYITFGAKSPQKNFHKDFYSIRPGEFLFCADNKAFHIRDGKLISEAWFENEVGDVYCDRRGDFWVGTMVDGLFRYPGGDLYGSPVRYLEHESITSIKQDMEGTYWFATNTHGIYQTNSIDIAIYQPSESDSENNVIISMAKAKDKIFLGTQAGRLYKLLKTDPENYTLSEIPGIPSTRSIRKLFYTPDNHLILLKDALIEMDLSGNLSGIGMFKAYAYEYTSLAGGQWMVTFDKSIHIYNQGKLARIWNHENLPPNFVKTGLTPEFINKIRTLHLDGPNRLFIGSQNLGLISSGKDSLFLWSSLDTLFSRRIHDIARAGKNIWVSVADYGISVIRPDSTILRITQSDGLSSDIVDVLYRESDSVVWAGTNLGANRITLNSEATSVKAIEHFTMNEGLPSNRIYQITQFDDKIWLATTQGVVSIGSGFMQNRDTPIPYLLFDTTQINGVNKHLKDGTVLPANQNNLFFKFRAISYKIPHIIKYQYFLQGKDKDTIETGNPEARYPDLGYGDYTLFVRASYTDSFSSDWTKLSFSIDRRWYETRGFILIVLVVIFGLIYLIFKVVLRDIREREMQKLKLLEAEKRSLLSQMNPHFIFNSLNSIQHFIVQNDEFLANSYLTNFSSLIRRILDNSKKNLINLNEEITVLELYLQMEKLRFEDDFHYDIIRDQQIDYNEAMIPPMLLQPIVENAIWHGLMPLKSKGNLSISFLKEHDFVHCRVEDNGIGREKAAKLKGKKEPHLSTGLVNVEERIRLMNLINAKPIELKITDLTDDRHEAAGTLVEIKLPINWQ